MPRLFARILGLFVGVSIVAGVAGAVAAVNYKKKAPARPESAADELELVAVMDAAQFASTAPAFRGGRVICWYAGVDVDLRDATFDPGGARLEVRTVFGGTRVVVASGVPVTLGGPAVFGGRMDLTKRADAAAPAPGAPGLAITGFTIFGALQVIAADRGEEIAAWAGDRNAGHHADRDDAPAALEVASTIVPT